MQQTNLNLRRIRQTLFSGTVYLGLVLLAASLSFAQGPNDESGLNLTEPSIQGVVSNLSGATFQMLGGAVTVQAGAAKVYGEQNQMPLTWNDVKNGIEVTVYGTPAGPGQFSATVIEVHGPKSDGLIQGKIDSVDLAHNTVTVSGLAIELNGSTMYDYNNNIASGPNDLRVGQMVDIHVATFQNKLIATKVSLDQGGEQGNFETNSESEN